MKAAVNRSSVTYYPRVTGLLLFGRQCSVPLGIWQRKTKNWGLSSNEKGSSGLGAVVPEVVMSKETSRVPAAERNQVL